MIKQDIMEFTENYIQHLKSHQNLIIELRTLLDQRNVFSSMEAKLIYTMQCDYTKLLDTLSSIQKIIGDSENARQRVY